MANLSAGQTYYVRVSRYNAATNENFVRNVPEPGFAIQMIACMLCLVWASRQRSRSGTRSLPAESASRALPFDSMRTLTSTCVAA
jgi:hypothetical protein